MVRGRTVGGKGGLDGEGQRGKNWEHYNRINKLKEKKKASQLTMINNNHDKFNAHIYYENIESL